MKAFSLLFILCSLWLFYPATLHAAEPLPLDESTEINTDILPIKPIEPLTPPSLPRYLILSAIIISIISILFILLQKKRKHTRTVREKNILTSPYLEAMSAINRLENLSNRENRNIKKGYFVLSKILRTYIAQSVAIPARDLTTEEIRPLLEMAGTKKWYIATDLLKTIDAEKFSNFRSLNTNYEKVINQTKNFLLKTRHEAVIGKKHA